MLLFDISQNMTFEDLVGEGKVTLQGKQCQRGRIKQAATGLIPVRTSGARPEFFV